MSVRHYQQLLREARSELEAYVRMTDKDSGKKTLDFLKYTHTRMIRLLDGALSEGERSLDWKTPETGAWRAESNGYELNIYKDGGVYYWTIGCTDDATCDSLAAAKREVAELVGAA